MTLVIGFALIAACWIAVAYGRDIRACLGELRRYLTDGPTEQITDRHPWMAAMDEIGSDR